MLEEWKTFELNIPNNQAQIDKLDKKMPQRIKKRRIIDQVNDIWEELQLNEYFASSRVVSACRRISSKNRGGEWVVGKRINSRYVFLTCQNCATLNEVHDIFEDVTTNLYI